MTDRAVSLASLSYADAVTVRLRFTPVGRKALKRAATLVVRGGTIRGSVTLRR